MAKALIDRARAGTHVGEALVERLADPAFRDACALSPDEMKALARIASGHYVRNALVVLKAIELKASYAYGRPRQAVDVNASVSLESLVLASLATVQAQPDADEPAAQRIPSLVHDDAVGQALPPALPSTRVSARAPRVRRATHPLSALDAPRGVYPPDSPAPVARGGPTRAEIPTSNGPGLTVKEPVAGIWPAWTEETPTPGPKKGGRLGGADE